MAPLRSTPNHLHASRRRSSLSLLTTRRRSFVPKNYTFAPNVTPVTYPFDPASPSSNDRLSVSPNPDGVDGDIKESDDVVTTFKDAPAGPDPSTSRPRRRGGRKGSVDHIPRPPNAFMLFRQNFVHQRHVPGSIETSHNSLSKIVGNCWKALPSKEKKVWEALADKKKEEHKLQYPHYRFQPKHDPEKKRKRQAARAAAERAERERIMRERGQLAGSSQTIPEETTGDNLQLQQPDHEQEKERAMATRREQVRVMHNHLGHRRSSSVPLPSETYPGYPYSNLGGGMYDQAAPVADPFNFANPALAHAPPSSNGIALPTLPSAVEGATNSWYPSNNAGTSDQQDSTSDQANGQLSLNHQLHAPQPRAATLSRAAAPHIPMNVPGMGPAGFGFGEFSGMSSMGMNLMGMGPRASRQWALSQLGRRASSTQPILQHQLASGAFNNYHYGGPHSAFPHPGASPFGQHGAQGFTQGGTNRFDFAANQSQQQGGFDGFVGAVAEGFTNPFASSALANSSEPAPANTNSAPASAPGSYPAPLAPNAMWYEVDSVDPMTPVVSQPPAQYAQASVPTSVLPPVGTTMLNPSFSFADNNGDLTNATDSAPRVEVPSSPKSALSSSAPQSSMQTHFGPMSATHVHTSNSAPGTGMRDSFDFSALLSQLPAQGQGHHQEHGQYQAHIQGQQQSYESVVPNSQSTGTQYPLAQPVPVRKVGLPCVPETQTAPAMYHKQAYPEHSSYQGQCVREQVHVYPQEQVTNQHDHSQYLPSTQTSSASSGSSADASPASRYIAMASQRQQHQYQSQQHHAQQMHRHQQTEGEFVSGHELLDGPVDVNDMSAHPSGIQQQAPMQTTSESCAPGVNALDFSYEYSGMGTIDAQNMYQMHMGLGEDANASGYTNYAHNSPHAHAQDGNMNNMHEASNAASRFSFSDFVHGPPFIASAPAAAN